MPGRQTRLRSQTSTKSPNPAKPDSKTSKKLSPPSQITVNENADQRNRCPCLADENQPWIMCSECDQWWHSKCSGLSQSQFAFHCKNSDAEFRCAFCSVKGIKNSQITSQLIHILRQSSIANQKPIPDDSVNVTSTEESQCAQEHIVILDKVATPRDFIDSSDIKREINRCKPDLKVKHAYSLPAGGIALHLQTREAEKTALAPWPEDAFGANVQAHKPNRCQPNPTVVVKNINTSHTEQELEKSLKLKYGDEVSVKRLWSNRSDSPLPIIKVTLNQEVYSTVLKDGISVLNRDHKCYPKHTYKVVRCYNCQKFGHISKTCKHISRCQNCAEHHDSADTVCRAKPCCANCGGSHQAYSTKCPEYTQTLTKLKQRNYTINHA